MLFMVNKFFMMYSPILSQPQELGKQQTLIKVNPFVLSLSKDERIYSAQGG